MKPKKVKTGEKRMSSVKRSFDMKGKWKPVELDPNLLSQEGMQDLLCFEELTSYRLVDSGKDAKQLRKEKKRAKKRGVEQVREEAAEPVKKKKKKPENVAPDDPGTVDCGPNKVLIQDGEDEGQEDGETGKESAAVSEGVQSSNTGKKKKKKQKKKKKSKQQTETTENQTIITPPQEEKEGQDQRKAPKKQTKNWTDAGLSGSEERNSDMSAWKDLFVPSAVLKALSRLGFTSPTPIQALALPPAIRDRMDILGAAETGSGKTLAFGIPMIHTILEWKDGSEKTAEPGDTEEPQTEEQLEDNGMEASEEEDKIEVDQTLGSDEDQPGSEDDEDEQLGCVRVIEDAVFDFNEKVAAGRNRPLLGLVLTPTRELAVQVKHHIDAVAKHTDIQTAILVGGMAQQKQRRMLKRRPEIVIATPGRLWDLIKERHPHLINLRQLKCLVIDEADRMVEKGHFAELESLLEMLNTTHFNPARQTFVFSATLTMVHGLPSRVLQKKKKKLDSRSKLEILMEKVGIKSKPKVIDLTRKEATVESLTETQIHCQKDEKDFYLYYFLLQYPGRTMVFANSIDCIKRLNALLVILDCSPLPLHANMHQKHRLKNLERFAERQNCVLLTTDVAARGLDIPDVQHVIHYQVPRTSETYVHRSGRTARATKEGLSLLLIGPDDVMNFKKISKTLGKDEEELSVFPVETKCMEAIKERVNLARKIEKIEYYNSREKQHDSWFKKAAEALEVDLDDDLLIGGGREQEADREQQKMVKEMKKHLKHLISQPVFKNVVKTKYPTKMGKLALANVPVAGMESALTRISGQKTTQKLKRYFPRQQKEKKQRKRMKKQV